MPEIKLVRPDESYAAQYISYRDELLAAGSSMDGAGPIRRIADPLEWLAEINKYENPATIPENFVRATQFLAVRPDNHLVGMIQVRHYFNDFLEKYAGHIGYSVRPSERRKGYATAMLAAVLPFCRQIGLNRILISCLIGNEASRRTILRNGGVYESTVFYPKANEYLERYWITL